MIDPDLDMDYRIHFRSGLWWSIGKPCEDAPEVVWEQCLSEEVSICAAEHSDRCFLPVRPDYRLAIPRGRSSDCVRQWNFQAQSAPGISRDSQTST